MKNDQFAAPIYPIMWDVPPIYPLKGPTLRAIASTLNGGYGGQARARRYESVILSEWASKGGKAVLEKYGREHFVELRKRRNTKPKPEPEEEWPSPEARKRRKKIAATENGRIGGYRRAERYYPECRSAMAREGGIATRNRYGNEYFREIRKKRKHYAKNYLTRKTWQRLREDALQNANTSNWPMNEIWLALARSYERDQMAEVLRKRLVASLVKSSR